MRSLGRPEEGEDEDTPRRVMKKMRDGTRGRRSGVGSSEEDEEEEEAGWRKAGAGRQGKEEGEADGF